MKNTNMLFCLVLLIVSSCNKVDDTEKYQKHLDNIVDVHEKIVDIEPGFIFGWSIVSIIDDYLFINEMVPQGKKGVHILNKNTFKYITNTAFIGKGPGEQIRPTGINRDYNERMFWISDFGKNQYWKFSLDSVLNNPNYKPSETMPVNYDLFVEDFAFLNDSIAIGKAVIILPNHSFVKAMARLNINTNKIEKFGYEHPDVTGEKTHFEFKYSPQYKLYAKAHAKCDLLTICDDHGNLRYNIYGPGWKKNRDNKNAYFFGLDFYKNYIICSYSGEKNLILDEYQRQEVNLATKFLVFDLEGNYKKTLETGNSLSFFCVDEENQRLIVYFDDRENPLGYIDLSSIL